MTRNPSITFQIQAAGRRAGTCPCHPANQVTKNKKIFELFKALSSERICGESLGISHVKSPVFHVLKAQDPLLMIEAANVFVIDRTKTETFLVPQFYSTLKRVFVELHEFFRDCPADIYSTFILYMTVTLQGMSGKQQSMKRLSLTNMQLFKYGLCDKKKRWADSGMQQYKQLISRIKKCFTTEDVQPNRSRNLKEVRRLPKQRAAKQG